MKNEGDKLTEAERNALLERGRELMQRARERNKGVPHSVIEAEVASAVDEVRRSRLRKEQQRDGN